MRADTKIGGWDEVVAHRTPDAHNASWEVRLSERGKLEASRRRGQWEAHQFRIALSMLPPPCHNAAVAFPDGPEPAATNVTQAKLWLELLIGRARDALRFLPSVAEWIDPRLASNGQRWSVSFHVLLKDLLHSAEAVATAPDCPTSMNRTFADKALAAATELEQRGREFDAALGLPATKSNTIDSDSLTAHIEEAIGKAFAQVKHESTRQRERGVRAEHGIPKTKRGVVQVLRRAAETDQQVIQLRRDGKSYRAISKVLTASGRPISKSEVERIVNRNNEGASPTRTVPRHGTGEENLTIQERPGKSRISVEH